MFDILNDEKKSLKMHTFQLFKIFGLTSNITDQILIKRSISIKVKRIHVLSAYNIRVQRSFTIG